MRRLRRAVRAAILLAPFLGVLCARAAEPAAETEPRGAALRGYAVYCAPCHGTSGRGDGPFAADLPGARPRDFTRGLFQFRSTSDRARPEDLARTVLRGMPGTQMPAFRGILSEEEARAIAAEVLRFSPRSREEPPGEPLSIPPHPPSGPERVARGKELFLKNCASCHGTSGRGDGPKAGDLRDAWGRPVQPRNLTRGVFEGGGLPEELYRTISAGMEGIPMPPYGFLLEPEEIWDLVDYVRTLDTPRSPWWRFLHEDPLDPTRGGEHDTGR